MAEWDGMLVALRNQTTLGCHWPATCQSVRRALIHWVFKSKSQRIPRSLHWDPPICNSLQACLTRQPLHPEQEIVEHWVVQVVN